MLCMHVNRSFRPLHPSTSSSTSSVRADMVKALVTIEFMGQMLCVGKFRRLRGQRRCYTRIENTEGARVFERMMLR